MDKLDALLTNIDEFNKQVSVGDSSILASIIIEAPNGDLHFSIITPDCFESPATKTKLCYAMGDMLKKVMAERYVFVSEVWHAKASVDPEVQKLAPAERSDRDEALMFVAVERDGKRMRLIRPILRGEDGKISGLGDGQPEVLDGDNDMTGRFANFFDYET
jgi:hypothetical protein